MEPILVSTPGRCATTHLSKIIAEDFTIVQERAWSKYVFVLSRLFPRQLNKIRQAVSARRRNKTLPTQQIYLDPLLIYLDAYSIITGSSFKPVAFLYRDPISWVASMESKINSLQLSLIIKSFPLLHISASSKTLKVFQNDLIREGASPLSARLFVGYLEICILFNSNGISPIRYESIAFENASLHSGNKQMTPKHELYSLFKTLFANNADSSIKTNSVPATSRFSDYTKLALPIWNSHFNPNSPFYIIQ